MVQAEMAFSSFLWAVAVVTRGVAAKPSAMRAAAVSEAPVSFQEKETGTGWRKIRPSG